MYTVKVSFKDILFDEDQQKAIITFFLAHKNKDFSYYAIFNEAEYIQSVHGDINVWVVSQNNTAQSDDTKYVIKYESFEDMVFKLEKLTKDLLEVNEENNKILEEQKNQFKNSSKEHEPIGFGKIALIIDILNFFIDNREDDELYNDIVSHPEFNSLKKLFTMLELSNIKPEILTTLLNNLEEISLHELYEMVEHHAKISKTFSTNMDATGVEMNVGGELQSIEDKDDIKDGVNVNSINPFSGMFK